MLKHWKKDGPDIVSHVHPHDLYEGFDEQWERDLADGYEPICQADTLEELAEKAGIDVDGLISNVEEYNAMCAEGYDGAFEKEAFDAVRWRRARSTAASSSWAYGTLGACSSIHNLEVMTDEHKVIPGLYCVGTDACTIYGDSYNYCIPGNTMGFCLNSAASPARTPPPSSSSTKRFAYLSAAAACRRVTRLMRGRGFRMRGPSRRRQLEACFEPNDQRPAGRGRRGRFRSRRRA